MADLPRMQLSVEYQPVQMGLHVRYTPIDAAGRELQEWLAVLHLGTEEIPQALRSRLTALFSVLETRLPRRPVEFPDGPRLSAPPPPLGRVLVTRTPPNHVMLYTGAHSGSSYRVDLAATIPVSALTPGGRALLTDVLTSIEAECWKDLSARMGAPPSDRSGLQVFISYRKRPDVQAFAESVAQRLAQEGVRPRFDEWDMLAGDSLPGKIAEAFEQSQACIIILSRDFKEGAWATREMETAITKGVADSYRVIPALFEECAIPELLKPLLRLDFRAHINEQFEAEMQKAIRALFGLTRRPF